MAFLHAVREIGRHAGGEHAAAWSGVRKLRAAAYTDVAMLPYRHVLLLWAEEERFASFSPPENPRRSRTGGIWQRGHVAISGCAFSVCRERPPQLFDLVLSESDQGDAAHGAERAEHAVTNRFGHA